MFRLFLVLLFGFCIPAVSTAGELPRTILGLHDAPANAPQDSNYLYALAEMPLNHLGLKLEIVSVAEKVPAIAARSDLKGVLIWLNDGRRLPFGSLLKLVQTATSKNIPVVMIGSIPNGQDRSGRMISLADQNKLLKLLGLQSRGTFLPYTFDLKTAVKVPEMVEFERKIPNPPPATESISPLSTGAESFLAFERSGDDGENIHAVVVTPQGGYVASGFSHFENKNGSFLQWYINPFKFFEKAFRVELFPAADTTTVAGRRIYYSHIDGDGWGNISTADKYAGKGTYASEVVLREVVQAYPDLPVTVAPIAADLDAAWSGTLKSQQIARALFAEPNVEPATHTYTHPFEWRFFGPGYKPESELAFLKKYSKYHVAPELAAKHAGAKAILKHNYDAPRAYADIPYTLKREVEGSAAFINSFCPPGKRVKLLQWSGDTSPTEDAVAAVIKAGMLNMNGRDTRFDGENPSYASVSPVGKRSGRFMQISASHANENVYTDLWQGRFFGFRYLKASLANTERPLRVKPVNIYYHMYSGEKQASLSALREVLDYASTQELTPVTATDYAAIGQGFYSVQFYAEGKRAWRVENRGALNTIRFDAADNLQLDTTRSRGVLGQRRNNSTLYIALDPAIDKPTIALSDRDTLKVTGPILVDSRWTLQKLRTNGTEFTFSARGYGPGTMSWIVPVKSAGERWEAVFNGARYFSSPSDATGYIKLALPKGAESGTTITIKRSTLRPAIL